MVGPLHAVFLRLGGHRGHRVAAFAVASEIAVRYGGLYRQWQPDLEQLTQESDLVAAASGDPGSSFREAAVMFRRG
jgi:hypothetical protein